MKYKTNNYVGLTYPRFLDWNIWRWAIYGLWKKFLCPKHCHLFDETLGREHTLDCSVCGLVVHIALVETREQSCKRAKKSKYIETAVFEKSERDPTHHVQLQ